MLFLTIIIKCILFIKIDTLSAAQFPSSQCPIQQNAQLNSLSGSNQMMKDYDKIKHMFTHYTSNKHT
jgi:hypothetical protein